MKTRIIFISFIALAAMTSFYGCKKNKLTGTFTVLLTDTPANYEKVNVDIQKIEVQIDARKNSGWHTLTTKSGVYDLLQLTNGKTTEIANLDELPVGTMTTIKLVLGNNNSVQLNGITYAMTVPGGTQNGIVLTLAKTLSKQDNIQLTLDFNAGKSVVQTSPNNYLLQPVITVLN